MPRAVEIAVTEKEMLVMLGFSAEHRILSVRRDPLIYRGPILFQVEGPAAPYETPEGQSLVLSPHCKVRVP